MFCWKISLSKIAVKIWKNTCDTSLIQLLMISCFIPKGTYPITRRESRHTGASPFSFTISVLGSFTCITQHTFTPTPLRPIRMTKQLWLSVLLKDTSAATGQAGIRTHILATPELESNALDRSATTLHKWKNCTYKYTHCFLPWHPLYWHRKLQI